MRESRFSFAMSKAFRFTAELQDLIALGQVRNDIAQTVVQILNGKASVNESFPVPAPWSEEAKNQASLYSWNQQYGNDPRYQDGETPIEKLLSKF